MHMLSLALLHMLSCASSSTRSTLEVLPRAALGVTTGVETGVETTQLVLPPAPSLQTTTATITVWNPGSVSLDLSLEIKPSGAFALVQPPAALAPGAAVDLLVSFTPDGTRGGCDTDGLCTATLTLTARSTALPDDAPLTTALSLAGLAIADADGDGFASTAAGGLDCDDTSAAVHPQAAEVCDGDPSAEVGEVDNDCDGVALTDCDGDSFTAPDDCAPLDAAIHPAATELPSDGLDNDCDGLTDERPPAPGEWLITEVHPAAPAWIEVCSLLPSDSGTSSGGSESLRQLGAPAVGAPEAAGALVLGRAPSSSDDLRLPLPALALRGGDCLTICRSSLADCDAVVDLQLAASDTDTGSMRVTLEDGGGRALDAVAWSARWDPPGNDAWALSVSDPSCAAPERNERHTCWCVAAGSPGGVNPSCR